MMAELRVIETDRSNCIESVVELLEEALEDAKNGEIIAVGLAIVRPDGAINTAFSESDYAGAIVGATALLQSRLIASIE